MNPIYIELIAKLGLDVALVVLKRFQSVTTIDEAIAALESIKTAQQYIDDDATARGVPAVLLPVKPAP